MKESFLSFPVPKNPIYAGLQRASIQDSLETSFSGAVNVLLLSPTHVPAIAS